MSVMSTKSIFEGTLVLRIPVLLDNGKIEFINGQLEQPNSICSSTGTLLTFNVPSNNETPPDSHNYSNNVTKKRYMCDVCEKGFLKPSQLQRHMRIHTNEKPFQCSICEKAFNQKGSLQAHFQSIHEKVKSFVCEICDCKFALRGNLRAHQKIVHNCDKIKDVNLRRFNCEQCPCVFQKLSVLNSHISQTHARQTKGLSENAPNGKSTSSLSSEKDISSSSSCIENKTSPTEEDSELSKNHDGPNVAEVELCYDVEGKQETIKLKVKKVGKRKHHLCNSCTKSFRKPSDLIRHIRTHTKERPFHCSLCTKAFSVKSTLISHLKTHVITRKQKTCQQCQKTFPNLTSLRKHKRSDHTERSHSGDNIGVIEDIELSSEMNCTAQDTKKAIEAVNSVIPLSDTSTLEKVNPEAICSESNVTCIPPPPRDEAICVMNDADNHDVDDMPVEPVGLNSLNPAPEPVSVQQNFEQVERNVNQNLCHICEKSFRKRSDLLRHIRIHTGDRPFECFTCGKRFRVKSTCVSHMRIHEESKQTATCDICKSKFATNSSLKVHMRLHTGVRPFKCLECNKNFRTSGHLLAHKKTHLKSKSSNSKISSNKSTKNSKSPARENTVPKTIHFGESNFQYNSTVPILPPTANFTEQNKYSSSSYFSNAEKECLKLIGSLQLPIENLQNIQITSIDMNNVQTDDLLPNVIIINPPTAGVSGSRPEEIVLSGMTPNAHLEMKRNVNLQTTVTNNLDPFLTEASKIPDESVHTQPTLDLNDRFNEISDSGEADKKKNVNSKQCPVCRKFFFKPSQLARHQRIHTKEKPFSCKICHAYFSQKCSLDTHMFTHMSEKIRPFQCSECAFSAVGRAALKKHCSRAHPHINFSKVSAASTVSTKAVT